MSNNLINDFSSSFHNEADTDYTRRQMRKALLLNIQRKYKWIEGDELSTIVDTIMDIHGLSSNKFNGLKMFQELINNNVNDVSVDDNSNKNETVMAGIYSEVNTPFKKVSGYDFLYRTMKELYGKNRAKRLTGELLDFSLGLGDSTNIMIPYCYALDASKLVTLGRDFGMLPSKPCKRIDSYISSLCETIHQMSSHLAGAIAIGTLFFDIAHLGLFKMGIPLGFVKTHEKTRKKYEDELQQFVHSVNHLSRNSNECVTEDTEVLTPNGFKTYEELSVGDDIYTWKDGKMEIQQVQRVNISDYDGEMHQYKGRDYNQVVTPNHRVLRKRYNSSEYELIESSKIFNNKTPESLPVAFNETITEDYTISDEMLKLITIVLCDGSFGKSGGEYKFVNISKSPHRFGNELIKELFSKLDINYKVETKETEFGCNKKYGKYLINLYRLSVESSKEIVKLTNGTKKELPSWFNNLSKRQANIVLETWAKFDGSCDVNNYNKTKLQCDNHTIADVLQHVAVIAGKGSKIAETLIGNNKTETIYLNLYNRKNKGAAQKNTVRYTGKVWCPTTENGIVVFRKEGRVFISGNSPFTNISIFDKTKILHIIKEDLNWYFPQPEHDYRSKEEWERYCTEYVWELQKIFLDFFDKGDPTKSGLPYRFPVVTYSLTKSPEGEIVDEEAIEDLIHRDVYRYNIFSSEGSKVASCCFSGEQEIVYKIGRKQYTTTFEKFNKEVDSKTAKVFDGNEWVEFNHISKRYTGYLYTFEFEDGDKIVCTENHRFPCLNEENKLVVVTAKIIFMKGYQFIKGGNKLDKWWFENTSSANLVGKSRKVVEEYPVYCVDLKVEGDHYKLFVLGNKIYTHNCRLINDVEMLELASQSNSFGAGALAAIGSHRVCTINFNRMALESETIEDFWRIYKYRCEATRDILVAHKRLMTLLTEANLQQFIKNGWINLNRLFSTIGILGIYECVETLKSKFGVDETIKEEILTLLDKRVKRFTKESEGCIFNIEQIPAESFAVRLAKTDKLIFSEEEVPYELYANQFVPLWKDASIWERLSEDGKYNQLLTGGGIVHATIGENVLSHQAKAIIEYATKVGCEHFALNAIYSVCENGHTHMGDIEACPSCSGKIIEKLTRVVGFFTPVSSWNPVRKNWEFPRRTKVNLEE